MTNLKRRLTVIRLPPNLPSCIFLERPLVQRQPTVGPTAEDWFCGKCGDVVTSGIRPESLALEHPSARQIIIECGVCQAYNVAPVGRAWGNEMSSSQPAPTFKVLSADRRNHADVPTRAPRKAVT